MSGVLRRISTSVLSVAKTTTMQRANVISGPPKHQIAMAWKVTIGLGMIGVVIAPCMWVLVNVKNYRKHGADVTYG